MSGPLHPPATRELGDARQVLTAPAHPYTRKLLEAAPGWEAAQKRV